MAMIAGYGLESSWLLVPFSCSRNPDRKTTEQWIPRNLLQVVEDIRRIYKGGFLSCAYLSPCIISGMNLREGVWLVVNASLKRK